MIDVVGVPDGFVQLVGEAQCEDVLHRLFTEVVVDAEHTVGWKHRLDNRVQFTSGLQVTSEGLLDDDSTPFTVFLLCQPRVTQPLCDLRKRLGWNRQVEGVIAHGPAITIQLLDRVLQSPEGRGIIEFSLHEPNTLRQLGPDILIEGRACVLLDRVIDDLGEVLVFPVSPRESDEREPGGK